ncbi:hypothetical protein [Nesterenkonia halotolerans]|uniref:Uncharacterized protein n=1 Tax=Nesterenkonia halotolerans TaxID=225325 RepID=A0ABR9J7R5_9MICC|nr:hypothetical protein [Nesterenkonia halotolerans]MBE1514889.1 hypothetical protein [Nesterenkonia halotolerans]
MHIIPDRPVVFDVSGVNENDTVLVTAVQSFCWDLGTVTVATEKIVTTDRGIPPKHHRLLTGELWKVLHDSAEPGEGCR